MILKMDGKLEASFPQLRALICEIRGVKVAKRSSELESFKTELIKQVRKQHSLESLKDLPTARAYRDFFWRVGVDPTKNRPAAEALIRRILRGEAIPNINTLVDAYNLASIKTEIALAAFDLDRLKGDLLMRFAEKGEEFMGIGMQKPMVLQGGEIVVSDSEKLVAVYPHRDADNTKVTEKTKNIVLMSYGVPGIQEETLQNAEQAAIEDITRFCGGQVVQENR